MGLFSFIKNIGKASASEPKAEDLQSELKDLELGEGLSVKMDGDKVVLEGEATSQEDLEKAVLAVGNMQGVAEVETAVTVAGGAEAEPTFHTVEKGDTLSAVAKKVYGDANRYPEIFEANKPMLSHPDKIYPGQVLRIPSDS